MSDTLQALGHKIQSATDLGSVVRTMKVLSAANIVQYERAMLSLQDYFHTIELGLRVCFQQQTTPPPTPDGSQGEGATAVVVFGSDQGLVGQFNESMADFVVQELSRRPEEKMIWAVGERVFDRLKDAALPMAGQFDVPVSLEGVTQLAGSIVMEWDASQSRRETSQFILFHQRPEAGAPCRPVMQRLLPMDDQWWRKFAALPWPSPNLPEVVGPLPSTLSALIREYLFVSIFRACVESLAGECSTRLAAMQRAEKNIGQLREDLQREFHQRRQNAIDDELFDLVGGFEALEP